MTGEGTCADALGDFVLLSLASAATSDGLVSPDIGRLSDLAGCSASAVQKTLRRLAATGLLRQQGRDVWIDLAAVAARSSPAPGERPGG